MKNVKEVGKKDKRDSLKPEEETVVFFSKTFDFFSSVIRLCSFLRTDLSPPHCENLKKGERQRHK
jgi:hypothetical protein